MKRRCAQIKRPTDEPIKNKVSLSGWLNQGRSSVCLILLILKQSKELGLTEDFFFYFADLDERSKLRFCRSLLYRPSNFLCVEIIHHGVAAAGGEMENK